MDDLTERHTRLRRAWTAPQPTEAQITAGIAEDRDMAERIVHGLPGLLRHHAFQTLQALRAIQWIEAAGDVLCPGNTAPVHSCGNCEGINPSTCPMNQGTCGDQLIDWTCTLPFGAHPDWRHKDGEHWWTQTRCPAACGQPNVEHDCTKEII